MGRPKGATNKTDQELAFVACVERSLKAGGFDDGLVNLACRLVTNQKAPGPASGVLFRLLDMKFGKPKERHEVTGPDGERFSVTVKLIKPK